MSEEMRGDNESSIDIERATIRSLARGVVKLEADLREIRDESRQIVHAVLVAAVLVFVTIGVEIMLFHTK
jgi:hypothetical protein